MLDKIKKTVWNFTKVGLLCFGLYFLSWQLLTLIFYHDTPAGQRGGFEEIYWSMNVILFISYFIVYTKNINDQNLIVHEKPKFDFKTEVKAFFVDERVQIWVLSVLAVIYEVTDLLNPPNTPNMISTVLVWFFPSTAALKIPILGTVIGTIISLTIMVLTTVLIKYRRYKNWNGK